MERGATALCRPRDQGMPPTSSEAPSCSYPRGAQLLHFSKSGGTKLCELALQAGCMIGGKRCHFEKLQDGPWWLPTGSRDVSWWHRSNFAHPRLLRNRTCEARRAAPWAETEIPRSFRAVESTLPGGMLCPGYYHVTMLRDPITRMGAHARELKSWDMITQAQCQNYTEIRRVAPAGHEMPTACVPRSQD